MNWIRVKFATVFVLIFGLLACTPDKPLKREDQWRFAPPEIAMPVSAEGVERSRLKIGEASQKELPLDAELLFAAMTSDITLDIDSLCMRDGLPFEETFQIRTPGSLSFGSIVPANALLGSGAAAIECSFNFSAVNEHGSRHHFLIPGVKLVGGLTYGSLIVSKKLQRISPLVNSEAKVVVEVDELDQIAVDSKVQAGVAELTCADFTSRERFQSVDTVNWEQLAYKQPIEVLENVLRKFHQPCRLALKDANGARVEISAELILRYPAPEVQIATSTTPFGRGDDGGRRDISILNLKMTNSSNIDQTFALPSLSVPIRLVYESPDGFFYTPFRHPTAEISHSVNGAETVNIANGKTVFQIKAKSQVNITVTANGYFNYAAGGGWQHAGYLFLFSAPLRLERLNESGNKVEDIPIFNTLPHHFVETQVYVPHDRQKAEWDYVARNLRASDRLPSNGD